MKKYYYYLELTGQNSSLGGASYQTAHLLHRHEITFDLVISNDPNYLAIGIASLVSRETMDAAFNSLKSINGIVDSHLNKEGFKVLECREKNKLNKAIVPIKREPNLSNTRFKYANSEWVDDFLEKGRLRIATLYYYADEFENNCEIADPNEAWDIEEAQLDGTVIDNRKEHQQFLKDFGIKIDACGSMAPIGSIRRYNKTADGYIYCVSNEADESVMKRFKYDKCVKITDWSSFAKTIGDELQSQGLINDYQFNDVEYTGKVVAYRKGSGIFRKNIQYQDQYESRLFMSPSSIIDAKPYLFDIPQISKFLEIVNF